MWVRMSAMDAATFGLFGGLVTDNLHATRLLSVWASLLLLLLFLKAHTKARLFMWNLVTLPTHMCGSIIKGMRIPRASRVEEVFTTKHVPLVFSRKSVGKGRLCALACHQSSEGKRIPREGGFLLLCSH